MSQKRVLHNKVEDNPPPFLLMGEVKDRSRFKTKKKKKERKNRKEKKKDERQWKFQQSLRGWRE